MSEEPIKNEDKTKAEEYLDPVTGRFKEGNPGGGRPKGSISIKDLVRKHLEENPEDLKEFVEHFIKKNRELAWQMIEGKPSQDVGLKHGLADNLIDLIRDVNKTGDTDIPKENP